MQSVLVSEPDRLLAVYTTDRKNPGFGPLSHLNWKDYARDGEVFKGVLGYDWTPMSLNTGGEPQVLFGQLVSGNYFDLLGVRAIVGRTLGPHDDEGPGPAPVVVPRQASGLQRLGPDPE